MIKRLDNFQVFFTTFNSIDEHVYGILFEVLKVVKNFREKKKEEIALSQTVQLVVDTSYFRWKNGLVTHKLKGSAFCALDSVLVH